MAVKKSAAAAVKTEKVVAPKATPVAVAPVEVKAKVAKVEAAVAAPVAVAPAKVEAKVVKTEAVVAPPVAIAPAKVEAKVAKVETPVAASPVVEKLKQTVADVQKSVSGIVSELTKTQVKVSTDMDKVIKGAEEFVAFGQANVEAFMKSSQILATGLQDLGKHVAATAQAQYDEAVANAKALTSVKSVKEAFDLQTSLAKAGFEKALAETGKLTDASVKLAEQVSAPIAARVTVAVEKFGKAA